MTGTFTIEGQKTGTSSELSFGGDVQFFTDMGISTNTVTGKNSEGIVYASDGTKELKKFTEQSNSFTIDNITYNVNGISNELISMTSQTDTEATVGKVKIFIDDYNKIMDKIYDEIIEKKNPNFPPLTDAQKEDMSEEEIEKWEEKSKKGLLRNDRELRMFMEDVKQSLFGPIEGMGINLSDIGITSSQNYNEQGQIYLDEEKFGKALLENGNQLYQALTKTAIDKSQSGSLERMKYVFNKYVGNSNSIFAKKAGIEKTASVANNLFGEQIKRQQQSIKELQRKMDKKEEQLYKKFAALEASMNKFNSQMSYLASQ
jgi:flagellar hook-associated protein 2